MFSEHQRSSWPTRIALCVLTAIIIAGTAYICAWLSYRNFIYFRDDVVYTRDSIQSLRDALAKYKEETGSLPATLADLDIEEHIARVDDLGRPLDAWRRPLFYQVDGDNYDLYSLGRDGKPGGYGLDADIHAGKVKSAMEGLTLWQFTFDVDTIGIQRTCLGAGLLAFPICLLPLKKRMENRLSPIKVIMTHGLTAGFAVIVAVAISVLHLPSGH